MKVLQLVPSSHQTRFFEALATGLHRNGVEIELASVASADPPTWGDTLGIRHESLEADRRWQYPGAARRLSRLLENRDVDILHAHLFEASLLAAWVSKRQKTVVTRHHLDDVFQNGTSLHVRLDRWITERADRIVVPSDAVRDYMDAEEHSRTEHVRTIPYGFDFSIWDADEEEARRVRQELSAEGSFLLGMVARFIGTKGHGTLFDALSRLEAEVGNLKVLLLGSGDDRGVRAEIAKRGLENRVILGGYRCDIPACMRAFDVLVHPTVSESFGQVLVEAMAVGTPVISSAVGGTPSIVTHEKTGLLVPPGDPIRLAEAIFRLYRDRDFARGLACAGERDVRSRFTIPAMIEKHLELYHEMAAERSPP